ncbi:MAG: type I asparaginase [Prevotellaceae bacterium]|jgi:L-asparaginase|nr:type I asparaginase [Prevotellaceae bacterium]
MENSVLLIFTGGTILMDEDQQSKSLSPLKPKQVLKYLPELKKINVNIEIETFKPLIDSSDIQPKNWVEICKIIKERYDEFDGFVVLHGTDTMSFSASAVSFMLENLSKPVIFTGSQLPAGVPRSDAMENLLTAIEIAKAKNDDGSAKIQEVCLFFGDKLFRGNRTTKRNAEGFDAFASFNFPILAKSGVHIKYYSEYFLQKNTVKPLKINSKLDDNIAILKLFPGINEQTVRSILAIKNLKAVILETYGAGNACSAEWLFDLLNEADKSGIILLNITQCGTGCVEMQKYKVGENLMRAGVISGCDMTAEAAVTKLMFLLSQYSDNQIVKKYLKRDLKGEMTI